MLQNNVPLKFLSNPPAPLIIFTSVKKIAYSSNFENLVLKVVNFVGLLIHG